MSFLLSRTDVPEPSKYALKDRVVQIIGRGTLRDCNDPRISREHASIAVKGKTLILRALHLKPCFYRRKDSDAMSTLTLGESVELFHGDNLGLLPERNWYELIYLKNEDPEEDKNNVEAQNKTIQTDPKETQNDDKGTPTKRPHIPDQDAGAKKIKIEPESPLKEGAVPTINKAVEETENNTGKDNTNGGSSQALKRDEGSVADMTEKNKEIDNNIANAKSLDLNCTATSDDVNMAGDENKAHQRPNMETDISNNDANVSNDASSDSLGLSNPTDNDTDVHSSGDEVAVKKEPESPTKDSAAETNPDNTESLGQNNPQGDTDTDVPSSGSEMDVKKEPGTGEADDMKKESQSPDEAQPGTSKDQSVQAGPSNDGAAPVPPAQPRERCLYGAHCYRRNPQHKAQYSHPGDADYGEGEKAQCPYGAHCHRTDPRHWMAHSHPRGAHPPQRNRNGIRVVQRRGQFFYINAHAVHFHDDHYAVEDEDGQRVDYDYEF